MVDASAHTKESVRVGKARNPKEAGVKCSLCGYGVCVWVWGGGGGLLLIQGKIFRNRFSPLRISGVPPTAVMEAG